MRPWSGMAAVALFAASSFALGRGATSLVDGANQEPSPTSAGRSDSTDETPAPKGAPPIPVVQLQLVIAGLTSQGCDVAIKPGNASCKFKVSSEKGNVETLHVTSDGRVKLELHDVELRGADRVCTVAVTVHEAGQAPKTVYRGFRLATRAPSAGSQAPATTPSFTCYLSSPSKLARSGDPKSRR